MEVSHNKKNWKNIKTIVGTSYIKKFHLNTTVQNHNEKKITTVLQDGADYSVLDVLCVISLWIQSNRNLSSVEDDVPNLCSF
jgi:hypothetical protein